MRDHGRRFTPAGPFEAKVRADLAQARAERKAAYIRLLTAARRLRYIAANPQSADGAVIDDLRTEMSTTQYEIELIAGHEMVKAANTLRNATLDYLTAAQRGEDTDVLGSAARAAVSAVITMAQRDLAEPQAASR
jgi:hypothetical protein